MNLTPETNVLALSHTDLDGFGTNMILKSLGFKAKMVNLENSKVDEYISQLVDDIFEGVTTPPDVLFITDITPKEAVGRKLETLHQSGKTYIRLFDHHGHASALDLNKYEWASVVVEKDSQKACGTSLFYTFLKDMGLVPKEAEARLDVLVEEIRLYDTWEWEEHNHVSAKTLNDLFYMLGSKDFINAQVEKVVQTETPFSLFSPDEEKLIAVENKRISKYFKNKRQDMLIMDDFFTDGEGKTLVAGVVQADSYISELGHHLCEEYPKIDFALLLNLTHDKASLRAVKDHISLLPIVQRYGGGGHPHAAGCDITPMGMEFIQKVFQGIQKP